MKIAILGAGFAGLATAYYITHYSQGRTRIDLFDPEPIGKGPSGISLGLLHPYMGRKAMRSWRSKSCLHEVHRLITVASGAIEKPIVLSKGILRPVLGSEQAALFQERAQENPEQLEWWSHDASMAAIPGLVLPTHGGGLYVKEGLTLNVQNYLQGLFRACLSHGVVFKQIRGLDSEMIKNYDKVIVCLGANSLGFGHFHTLPMKPIKGQILRLKWPHDTPPLPMSLVGDKQIVMSLDQKSCSVGATYEHKFQDLLAHKEQAYSEIMPKISTYFPALANAEVLECRVGFRGSPANRFPLCGKFEEKFWFLTGLGSRGLLYHAWLGKRLAQAVCVDDLTLIPPEVLHELQPPPQS